MGMLPEITYLDKSFVHLISDFFVDQEDSSNHVSFGMKIESTDIAKIP